MPQSNENAIETPNFSLTQGKVSARSAGSEEYKGKLIYKKQEMNFYKGKIFIPTFNTKLSLTFNTINEMKERYKGKIINNIEKNNLYKGRILLSPKNILYGKVKLFSSGQNNYKGKMIFAKEGLQAYQGKIFNPTFNTKLIISFNSFNQKKELFKGKIINNIEKNNLYKGRILLSPKNILYGKVKLFSSGQNNYKGKMIYKKAYNDGYLGRLFIPTFNTKLIVKFNTINAELDLYKGKLITVQEHLLSFKGRIIIPPKNTLFGRVEIGDTPKHTFYSELIKDIYVNRLKPDKFFTLNERLYADKNNTIYLQWHFNKNSDEFFIPDKYTNSYIKWKPSYALDKPQKIQINIVQDLTWREHFTNYENKPDYSFKKEFTIPANYTGELLFELGDFLKDIDKSKPFDISMAITTESTEPILTYSRESLNNYPVLQYEYFIISPTMRTFLFKGKLNVKVERQLMFKGKMLVKSDKKDTRYKGKITIPTFEPIEPPIYKGRMNVLNSNRLDYKGRILVPVFKGENIFKGRYASLLERGNSYKGKITIKLFTVNEEYKGRMLVFFNKGEESFKGVICNKVFRKDLFKGKYNLLPSTLLQFKGKITIPVNKGEEGYKGKITLPIMNNTSYFKGVVGISLTKENMYKGRFTTFITYDNYYFGKLKVPKFNNEEMFKCKINLLDSYSTLFKGKIIVPTREPDSYPEYKGKIRVIPIKINMYKGRIAIISDKKKVRIFIM